MTIWQHSGSFCCFWSIQFILRQVLHRKDITKIGNWHHNRQCCGYIWQNMFSYHLQDIKFVFLATWMASFTIPPVRFRSPLDESAFVKVWKVWKWRLYIEFGFYWSYIIPIITGCPKKRTFRMLLEPQYTGSIRNRQHPMCLEIIFSVVSY